MGGFGAFGGASSYGGSNLGGAAQGSSRSGGNNGGSRDNTTSKSTSSSKGGADTSSATASAPSATSSVARNAAATAPAKAGIGDTSKGVMGGLIGAVQTARDSKAPSSTSPQAAVNGAFQSSESAAPEAARAGMTSSKQVAQGYDSAMNKGAIEGAFGAAGTPGSLLGKAVGAVTQGNPYGKDTSAAHAFDTGASIANDAGLGSGTRGLASLAAGVLGGPIGSALASMALSGVSYGMQASARENALPGIGKTTQVNPGNPTTNGSVGNNLKGQVGGAGGNGSMASAMGAAANPAATTTTEADKPFEFANNFDDQRNSYQKMNLGSII